MEQVSLQPRILSRNSTSLSHITIQDFRSKTMACVQSLLDNDLYKFTMQNAVLKYRQNIPVKYCFNNRRPEGKFNEDFSINFEKELQNMQKLSMNLQQFIWFTNTLPWFNEDYIQYLRNYRYNPQEVQWQVKNGELELEISGSWERTILWEVPLMATISELFFKYCDKNWDSESFPTKQRQNIVKKGLALDGISFMDFGTRRRRNFESQYLTVKILKQFLTFKGTSNVHLAHEFGVSAIGTMAHEWIMGISALESLRHANRDALNIWQKVYQGQLGIALTDTFHTDTFYDDFDGVLARVFDGVRHDSGNPYQFVDKTIKAYSRLGINPLSKTIVFSDGLNPEEALKLAKYCEKKINTSFGIGTNFTNDVENSPALNMVIKLTNCNGVPVVKLSDSPSKSIGDKDALRVAQWTFFEQPLN